MIWELKIQVQRDNNKSLSNYGEREGEAETAVIQFRLDNGSADYNAGCV